jgi:hypothetical protein
MIKNDLHPVRITFADGWIMHSALRTYPDRVDDPAKQAEADAKAVTEMLERFRSWAVASYRNEVVRNLNLHAEHHGIAWNSAMAAVAVPEIAELCVLP